MGAWEIQHRRICSFLRRGYDHIAEAYVHLHVNSGTFQASQEIDTEPLVFLIFLDSCDVERLRVENQTVIFYGLTDDLGKQSFDPSNAIFAEALQIQVTGRTIWAMRPQFEE